MFTPTDTVVAFPDSKSKSPSSPTLPPEVVRRLTINGPRYTSYPTADRFEPTFTQHDYASMLAGQLRGPAALARPLSLYVHVPFCAALCYYCACNKIVTHHYDRAVTYLQYLKREITLQTQLIGQRLPVSQLHLGGGTPTFLRNADLASLVGFLREKYDFSPAGEYSIEIDPRTVTRDRLAFLADLGFNRLSFGVQDLDTDVQRAVHRQQSVEQLFELVDEARALGFESINVDLIYGLPKQTPSSFLRTIRTLCELRPDRVAVYSYAHLPDRFKQQRRILWADLPDPDSKLRMFGQTIEAMQAAGYVYIGMDHFALPTDSLAIARQQNRLHRNFQGYSTQPDCDLMAFGVSAIGKVGDSYSQNARDLPQYYQLLDQGTLPVVRGIRLDQDDIIRRSVIMSLMCQGALHFADLDRRFALDSRRFFSRELAALGPFIADGLVALETDGFHVTARGWLVIRAIAMVFDANQAPAGSEARFSRIV